MASAFCALLRCFALALLLTLFFLGGFMVRTRCPSISKFRLGFSFRLVGLVAALSLVGAILLASSFCHRCSFLCACVGSIGCEYGCHALVLDSLRAYSFPAFALICLVLMWVCLLRVLSFLVGWFWTPFFFLLKLL